MGFKESAEVMRWGPICWRSGRWSWSRRLWSRLLGSAWGRFHRSRDRSFLISDLSVLAGVWSFSPWCLVEVWHMSESDVFLAGGDGGLVVWAWTGLVFGSGIVIWAWIMGLRLGLQSWARGLSLPSFLSDLFSFLLLPCLWNLLISWVSVWINGFFGLGCVITSFSVKSPYCLEFLSLFPGSIVCRYGLCFWYEPVSVGSLVVSTVKIWSRSSFVQMDLPRHRQVGVSPASPLSGVLCDDSVCSGFLHLAGMNS